MSAFELEHRMRDDRDGANARIVTKSLVAWFSLAAAST